MGINQQRHRGLVLPAGSVVADYFTPCVIPFAL